MLDVLRDQVGPAVWGRAVSLARDGAVVGVRRADDEIELRVKTRDRATPFEVYLWPDDTDWGCDCGRSLPCVHICAGAIATHKGVKVGEPLPVASARYRVKLRYDFTRAGVRLNLVRTQIWPDGREEPLKGTLAASSVVAHRGDVHAEALLAQQAAGPLDEERLRRLLIGLEGQASGTLDGAPVVLSADPVPFVVKVSDEGDRFRVALYRPQGLDALFTGAALVGGALHPTSYGQLTVAERAALDVRSADSLYRADQAPWLVGTYLPWLQEKGLEVRVESPRLPRAEALRPRVVVALEESLEGLRVRPEIIYGDPPVAKVRMGSMVKLSSVVVVRDPGAERLAARAFQEHTGLPVGVERLVPPGEAIELLRKTFPALGVELSGDVDMRRFRVSDATLEPILNAANVTSGEGSFHLDVGFKSAAGHADPAAVLRAFQSGRSLVPLIEGGYAPLPVAWLREHATLLEELLEARDAQGNVPRHATAALVELLEDTAAEVPMDLRQLHAFLEGADGLPELRLAPDFQATLRPYQAIGVRWMTFLRDTGLHGVLADDMGLGKTIQTLAVLATTPGRHLVVAPTSVLRNWEREAHRFVPGRKVVVYHGPGRRLEPDAWITLTSHAIMRLDRAELDAAGWTWMVLDEAQAIKNPDSQTSQAACRIGAKHRVALTGTPVENRLEELWSLFRFLMPGLLGTVSTFRERFVRPVEAGDAVARAGLRRRVRPYVLRRLKRQVAEDLPPLTEVVERCAMSKEQRSVYETVRAAMRREVLDLLGLPGRQGNVMHILEALLRMRQACCDPKLLPSTLAHDAPSAKLDRLEELLAELVPDGHKTLVFSQWTSFLDLVEPRLEALGVDYVRLDGGTRDRQRVVDAFQDPNGPPVFLLSLKAGGTGLNLTAADYVVHLDPWWNPAVQQQATDRAWRIGQDRPVVSIRLVAEDTVEERILELQDAKRGLADAALGEAGLLHALTGDELRALFL